MWTRVLQIDDAECCIFGIPTLEDGQELAAGVFTSGSAISMDGLRVPIVRSGVVHPVSMAMDIIPILDERAADAFVEHVGQDIQLIQSVDAHGQERWIANLLSVIDCIDRSRSKAEYYPDDYPLEHLSGCVKTAFQLAIDPSKTNGHHVFRIKGDDSKVVATTTFLEFLQSRGLKGLRASDVPTYRST